MTAAVASTGGFRRGLYLLTTSSFLAPVAGIVTSPILSQTLGVQGRGEIAAIISPNVLVVTVATLGLPEALTWLLARHPSLSRRALAWSALFATATGVLCLGAAWLLLPFLSAGNDNLAALIPLATALAIPLLSVNLLRGAATGRELWSLVAWERTANALVRVAVLLVLALTGTLTILTAVLVLTIGPIIAGAVYAPALLRVPPRTGVPDAEGATVADDPARRLPRTLLSFGSRVWVGAVSSMLLSRLGQIIFAPLSDVRELGLYVVAITISDVPLIFAIAVRDVLFSVNSKTSDPDKLLASSRLTLLVGVLICLVLGGTLPLWIEFVFGAGFGPAVLPTWILMVSALVSIPGFIAGAALSAANRPGLRSAALIVGLVVNLAVFLPLVPVLGAVGAALAALASAVASTLVGTIAAARLLGVRLHRFWLIRGADVARLVREARRVLDDLRRRRG